jgi:integrase
MAKRKRRPILLKRLLCEYFVGRGLDEGSEKQYRIVCRSVSKYVRGDATTYDIFTERRFAHFLDWLKRTPNPRTKRARSNRTINGKRGFLLALWRFAWRRRWAPQPPIDRFDIPLLPVEKRNPPAWTVEQVSQILAHVDAAPPSSGWSRQHWIALLLTCYDTGARIDALLGARRQDLIDGRLRLDASLDKELIEHNPRLHDQTLAAIAALPPGEPEDRLFDWQHSLDWLRKRLKAILRAAGLPHGRRDLFHRFRRTTATQTAKVGGIQQASQILGHSSVALTEAHYVDQTQLHRPAAVDFLPRPALDISEISKETRHC